MKGKKLSGALICIVVSLAIVFAFTGCNPDTPEPTTGILTVKFTSNSSVTNVTKYEATVQHDGESITSASCDQNASSMDIELAPETYEVIVTAYDGNNIVGRGVSTLSTDISVGSKTNCPVAVKGVLYVSDNGNDENDGSKGNPYQTVTKALAALDTSSYGTIILLNDITESTIDINKPISLVGLANDGSTTINGTIKVTAAGAVRIEQLTIKSTSKVITLDTNANNVTVSNCFVYSLNNIGNPSDGGSGIYLTNKGAKLTVENSTIDAWSYGISARNTQQNVMVKHSNLTGWAAIMTSAKDFTDIERTTTISSDTTISVDNSTLTSRTTTKGNNNYYGAVVLQEKYNKVTLSISNSTIQAIAGTKTAEQTACLEIRSYGNTVTVDNTTMTADLAKNEGTDGVVGGAVIRLGWAEEIKNPDSVTDGSTRATNNITITNSTLTPGADQKTVLTARRTKDRQYDNLTIGDTVYSVDNGNMYVYDPTSNE